MQQQQQQGKVLLPSQENGQARQLTSQTRPMTRPSQPLTLDDDQEMSDDEQFEDAQEGVVSMEPHPQAPLPSHQLVSSMGLSTHHVQLMKASFFGNEGSTLYTVPTVYSGRDRATVAVKPASRGGALHKHYPMAPSPSLLKKDAIPKPLFRSSHTPTLTPNQSLLEPYTSFAEDTTEASNGADFSFCSSRLPPALSSVQAQSSLLMAKHDLSTLVPQEKSLARGRQRTIADTGLFLGRSFRVGWGPNWTLVHSGTQLSDEGRSASSRQLLFSSLATTRSPCNVPLRVVVEKVDVSPFVKPDVLKDKTTAVSTVLF